MIRPEDPQQPAAPTNPAHVLRGMGEILVVLTACGYRLDQIMGVEDFRAIQRRMILIGFLDAEGQPTSKADVAAKECITWREKKQAEQRAIAEAEKQQTQGG